MFNPYFHKLEGMLTQKTGNNTAKPMEGILNQLSGLDSDDILILMLIFILFREGKGDGIWSLLAVLVYCML